MVCSVVIPAKQEPYLPKLLISLRGFDVHVQTEAGLSNAVLCGVKLCRGSVIAVLDADGSHNPKYVLPMTKRLSSCDVVVGSRYVSGGQSQDVLVRKVVSKCYCWVARLLLGLNVYDCMSGFIVAKREVYQKLKLHPVGYKFGLELMAKSKGRFRVVEYPVVFEKRKLGVSKAGFGQGLRTLAFVLKLFVEVRLCGYH